MRREPAPADRAGEAELIQTSAANSRRYGGRGFADSQALAGASKPCNWRRISRVPRSPRSLRAGRDMLPAQQPAHELRRRDRLNLAAQFADRETMNAREQAAFAPFDLGVRFARGVCELAAQNRAAGFEAKQRLVYFGRRHAERGAQILRGGGAGMRHPSGNQSQYRVFAGGGGLAYLGEHIGENRRSENLAEQFRSLGAYPIPAAVYCGAGGAMLAH